jgi:hypothetical protein
MEIISNQAETQTARKINISEIIGLSWKTLKDNAKFLIGVALVISIIQNIPSILNYAVNQYTKDETSLALINLFGKIICLILVFFLFIGLTQVILKIIDKKSFELKNIWPTDTKMIGNIISAGFMAGLLSFVGFILLIIPGIIWAIKYSFTTYLAIDGYSSSKAIKGSGLITQGYKWKLFWLYCVVFLIIIVISILGGLLIAPIEYASNSQIIGDMLQVVFSSVIILVNPIIIAHTYRKLQPQSISATILAA